MSNRFGRKIRNFFDSVEKIADFSQATAIFGKKCLTRLEWRFIVLLALLFFPPFFLNLQPKD